MANYNPAKIEAKWQKAWAKSKIYKSTEDLGSSKKTGKKDKYYILDMFPYPSGEGLHVGHPKGYIATDVISRFQRMNGKNVLHPMGFDAFGLPAENYAIKTQTNPVDSVKKNVARYKKQLEILGFDYDWSREVNTTDPEFYKWTQWIFLQMFKKGLAYESNEPVNWCPKDKTVLANEDVENGRCERCGTLVEKKPMRQWVLRITKYADRLLKDLDLKVMIQSKEQGAKSKDEESKIKIDVTGHSDGEFDINNLPHVVDKKNPPKEGKITQPPRRTIHALVRDPKTGKFLGLKWHNHPWVTFIVGGVERGEDIVEAAKREVLEETGYSDIRFVQFLGAPVKAEYFAAHKDVNRVAITSGILFELVSNKKREVALDEKKEHEPIWMDPCDMNEEVMTCAELPFWLERLPTASVEVVNGVPCFTQIIEPGTVRKELPFVERNAIAAVVKHWSEDKYIGLKWKKVAWQTLITGGIEKGQTAEEAARIEIQEETGYKNIRFIKNLGKVESKFFHVPKNENRHAHFDVLYFELEDGEKNEISEKEKANHEVTWVAKSEMADFITAMAQKYMWSGLFLGETVKEVGEIKLLLDWPESIKEAQRNWIGRSEGALINFKCQISNAKSNSKSQIQKGTIIEIFTTRPDTIFGVTYLVLAPEHKLVNELLDSVENRKEIESYITKAKNETEIDRTDAKKEKTGVELKGVKAVNPANGEEVPVWIADYVLPDYGTGAVMAVPAHDERDWEFAKKYNLSIRVVLASKDKIIDSDKPYIGNGLLINSGAFNDKFNVEILKEITSFVGGSWVTKYKLRDWVFSRQRYWGEPIPVIHCGKCGVVAVPEKDLPVKLPRVKSYEPTGTGESPLAAIKAWVNVKCPQCKGPAKRETNTMPQWAGSSWYYLRYEDPRNKKALVDSKKEKYWSPVDLYVGGAEHATRHLIYARFWHKFLFDIGAVSTVEPFIKLQSVGLIMGEDGRKMSKRFGNVVNPDDIVKSFGADTLRIYEMFMGPFDQQIAWSTDSMAGPRRFIERVWKLREKCKVQSAKLKVESQRTKPGTEAGSTVAASDKSSASLTSGGLRRGEEGETAEWALSINRILHQTIKKVTEDIQNLRFNTAISSLMIASNELEKAETITRVQFETLLKLLAPFAPHVAEELWTSLGNKKSIHVSEWPSFDASLILEDEITMAVQVNGKVRGTIKVAVDDTEESVKQAALELPEIKKWVGDKAIKKIIVVKGRLVSIVL